MIQEIGHHHHAAIAYHVQWNPGKQDFTQVSETQLFNSKAAACKSFNDDMVGSFSVI